tara:strand:- start:491 stop:1117 length:627 start_codon:yes stop_codon:yes gene_type:complete
MYLPKSQFVEIATNLAPFLLNKFGTRYSKPTVIKTSANEYYDAPQGDIAFGDFSNAERLVINITEGTFAEATTIPILPTVVKPAKKDYEAEKFYRYFLQVNKAKIMEISKEQFDTKSKNIRPFEKLSKLEWKLQGPINDITVKGNIFTGAKSVNRSAVMKLDKTMNGIKDIVTNYAEFITPTPADKLEEEKPNQVKTSFDIPSPSKKL